MKLGLKELAAVPQPAQGTVTLEVRVGGICLDRVPGIQPAMLRELAAELLQAANLAEGKR